MFDQCRGVIFDCDGVLVDSEYLCHVGLVEALRELGVEESPEALYRDFSGWPLMQLFRAMEDRHGCRLPVEFEAGYRRIVERLFDEGLEAVPGAEAVLGALQLPYCVASNGPRQKMEHSLGLTGLLPYFRGRMFSAYEVGAWKPDPGLFLAAAAGLGCTPAHCLVVEDSLVGVQAARAAGMPVLLYTGGRKLENAPAPVLERLADLPAKLPGGGQSTSR